jgi:uncharacterized protein DUF6159
MERIQRGIGLTRETWSLVRAQPSLLVLPAIALCLQAAVVVVVLGPFWFDLIDNHSRLHAFIGGAICAYPLTFISTFFNVAYYAQVDAAFRGTPIGVSDALARARGRLGPIAAWSLLSTAVGLALRAVEQLPYGGSVAGRIATWFLDAAWSLASFFVVPALALDDMNVRRSLRRSVTTIRDRWGEAVTGNVVIGGAGAIVLIPALLLLGVGYVARHHHPVAGDAAIAVAVAMLVAVMVIQSAVTEAFRVATYLYAVGTEAAGPFTDSELAAAFQPRKRRRFFG